MKTLEMYNNIIAALCTWREARGESATVQFLVAVSIVNRAKDALERWPKTLAGVVLQPKQFSSFNIGDPNASKVPALNDASFINCCAAVDAAINVGRLGPMPPEAKYGPLLEANHYHDDSIAPPSWTKNMQYLGKMGKLLFYKG